MTECALNTGNDGMLPSMQFPFRHAQAEGRMGISLDRGQ